MKGWLRDVEMEQCENRSHNGATSLARGGMLGVRDVSVGGETKDSSRRKSGDM